VHDKTLVKYMILTSEMMFGGIHLFEFYKIGAIKIIFINCGVYDTVEHCIMSCSYDNISLVWLKTAIFNVNTHYRV